jgi:hypothetical protein
MGQVNRSRPPVGVAAHFFGRIGFAEQRRWTTASRGAKIGLIVAEAFSSTFGFSEPTNSVHLDTIAAGRWDRAADSSFPVFS